MYRTGPAAALVLVALALASCGSGGSSSAGTTAPATAASTTKASAEPKDAPSNGRCVRSSPRYPRKTANSCGDEGESTAKTAAAGKPHGCEAQIGDFVDRMDDLRQSLLAGLSYAEYVVRVRAVRDAYEAVPVDHLSVGCLTGPATDAEDAFNQYLRAANTWGECAATAGCAASEIEGRLQHRWRIASKSLEAAKRG